MTSTEQPKTHPAPNASTTPVARVIVAEDSLLMREGIVRVLDLSAETTVVAECCDRDELLAAIETVDADVVVTDVRMPPDFSDEGVAIAMQLRETHPDIGVVVLSQYAEPAYASALLAEGSSGRAYLLKDRVSQPGELALAVRAVMGGGSVVDPVIVEKLVRERRRHIPSPLHDLTESEMAVLDEIAFGKSNAAIASALYLSERTVEKHIKSIFAKLGLASEPTVNRRVMAVLMKLRAGDE